MKRTYPFAVMTTEEPSAPAEPVIEGVEGTPATSAPVVDHWTASLDEEKLGFLKGFDTFEAIRDRLTVPEDYTAPEGVQLDQATFDGFKAKAKELGLTQAQIAEIAKFDAERMGNLPQTIKAAQQEQFKTGLKEMESKLGMEKFAEAKNLARATIGALEDAEFNAWLDETGLGDSPHFVRAFATLGRYFTEDSYKQPGPNAELSQEERALTFYPTMRK
jgi:hypothetical protein